MAENYLANPHLHLDYELICYLPAKIKIATYLLERKRSQITNRLELEADLRARRLTPQSLIDEINLRRRNRFENLGSIKDMVR